MGPRLERAYLEELRRLAKADEASVASLRKDERKQKARAAFARAVQRGDRKLTGKPPLDERHQAEG
jgi:hypothetical protein